MVIPAQAGIQLPSNGWANAVSSTHRVGNAPRVATASEAIAGRKPELDSRLRGNDECRRAEQHHVCPLSRHGASRCQPPDRTAARRIRGLTPPARLTGPVVGSGTRSGPLFSICAHLRNLWTFPGLSLKNDDPQIRAEKTARSELWTSTDFVTTTVRLTSRRVRAANRNAP
jgi:hypothetical protein